MKYQIDKQDQFAILSLNEENLNSSITSKDEGYETRMAVIMNKNYLRIGSLALYGIMFGYYLTIFNPLGDPLFKDVYKLHPSEAKDILGNVNMLFSIGAVFSVMTSGLIAEKIGRRRLIIVFDVLNLIIIAMYWVKDLKVLQVARFATGWTAAGSGMISAILITELMPKKLSGVANSLLFATMTSFIFVAYIQQNIFSRQQIIERWQVILCWPAIPLAIKAVVFPILVKTESPKFYIKENPEHPELKQSLIDIYSSTHRETQVEKVADMTIKVFQEQSAAGKSPGLLALFSPPFRRRLISGIVEAIAWQASGIGYFVIYSTDLFNRISGKGKQITFVIAVTKVFGGVFAVIFMKTFGRKFNLMVGTFIQGVSISLILFSISVEIPILSYIGVVVYMVAFAIGHGGAFQAYITEILPPKGASLCNTLTWIVNAVIVKILPKLADAYGDEAIMFGFAILCFIILFLLDLTCIETKDKSEDQVIQDFKNKPYRFMDFS